MSLLRYALAVFAAMLFLLTGCVQANSDKVQNSTACKPLKALQVIPGHTWAHVGMLKCSSAGECSIVKEFSPRIAAFQQDGKLVAKEGPDKGYTSEYSIKDNTLQIVYIEGDGGKRPETFIIKDLTSKTFTVEVSTSSGYYRHSFMRAD